MNNSKESRLVKRAIKKYKWDILKVWTLKILFLITSLSSMYISGLYINVLVTGVNWNLILKYMLVLAGLIIWEIMFNYWNVMRYYQTQANLVFYINYYVLKHIKRIRLSFFDDKDPAYLNQRVNEDINSIVNYKLDLICNMSISVLSFITIIGILSRVMIIQSSSYILKRKPVENPNKRLDINEKQYYGQKLKKNIFILYCVSLALFSMQKKTDIAIIGLTLTFIAISMIVGERLMDKK